MTLSEELMWRGFINQHTFSDITVIDKEPLTFYWGVDPSGPSMTIGHLAPAMMVRRFIEQGGHKAVLLIGGATGMIGDPDGKKQERGLLTMDQIEQNKKNIIKQYQIVFAGNSFEVVDNYDWFKDMQYLNFLREVGKKVPISQLLDREFVKSRIGENGDGISYAEFSYNLIQGYDFLHLFRTKNVTLQVAGADQWGNSITGIQLIKKTEGGDAHVLTTPLIINKATGIKFGKSESGAIWLDPALTTPYRFYQFWFNVDDEFAEELIAKYTMLSKEVIEETIESHKVRPQERLLQRKLADEVTRAIHGDDRLISVYKIMEVLFGNRETRDLSEVDITALAAEIPVVNAKILLSEALQIVSIVSGKGAARRLTEGGGVKVNGEKVDGDIIVNTRDLIKVGKNKFIFVR